MRFCSPLPEESTELQQRTHSQLSIDDRANGCLHGNLTPGSRIDLRLGRDYSSILHLQWTEGQSVAVKLEPKSSGGGAHS